MDSKSQVPAYNENESNDPAPPSYSETISSRYPPSSSTSQYYSSQIQSQLSSLTSQISSLQTQKDILSHAHDEKILSLLTLDIQLYLTDFAKTGLQRGTLILVPAQGLEDDKALPVDYDFKNPEEYDRVVRVRDKETDEYGDGNLWYWRDEDLAMRLAGYLRPTPDPRRMELPPRPEQVKVQLVESQPGNSSSRGFWGRKKSTTKIVETPPVEQSRDSKFDCDSKVSPKDSEYREDRVAMDVKAEEVVFRTENEFGIYGTERGWGVVVKLKVILGGR
jgi:hypothetical protein